MQKLDWRWIIGVVITIAVGLLPVVFPSLFSPLKSLVIKEDYSSKLISVNSDSLQKNLTVYFKEKKLQNLYLTQITIENNGKQPINRQDFEEPLVIKYDNISHIYDCEVINANPRNINFKVRTDSNVLFMQPMLLNSGDAISLRILISNLNYIPQINGRIAGVKEVGFVKKKEYNMIYRPTDWVAGLLLTTIAIGFIALLCRLLFVRIPQKRISFNRYLLMLVALICWYAGLALMENGARYYGYRQSFLIRILIFAPYYALVIYVTLVSARKKHKKETTSL